MNKKQWMIPLSAALLAVGLTGCANDDRSAAERDGKNDSAQPMGYYSNENHPDGRNGYLADNDGPIPEMMDHTIGVEDQVKNGEKRKSLESEINGNPPNPSKPLANHDHNFFQRDNRFSASDANYHGHLNRGVGLKGTTTNDETQDQATERIRRTVEGINNVQDVSSVIYGPNVVIAVELDNYNRIDETRRAIINAVKPHVGDRTVQVITDDGTLDRNRNRNNDIQHDEHNMQKRH